MASSGPFPGQVSQHFKCCDMPNGDLTRSFQTVRPGGASKRLTGGAGPPSRSGHGDLLNFAVQKEVRLGETESPTPPAVREDELLEGCRAGDLDRKSTRLNSSHV